MRDAYITRRRSLVYDGNPPDLPDADDADADSGKPTVAQAPTPASAPIPNVAPAPLPASAPTLPRSGPAPVPAPPASAVHG